MPKHLRILFVALALGWGATACLPSADIVAMWDRVAQCESTGHWDANTGNGYFGGLQMTLDFWRTYGGDEFAPRPDLATREQQIEVAERGRAARGLEPWGCRWAA